jgi:hypothetical protein
MKMCPGTLGNLAQQVKGTGNETGKRVKGKKGKWENGEEQN